MDELLRKYSCIGLFAGVVLLLVVHLIYPQLLLIDWATVTLIVLLILIPYSPFIKKLSFGAFEAELQPQIKQVREEIQNLLTKEEKEVPNRTEHTSNKLYSLLEEDYKLALAKLRMDLEDILRKIVSFKDVDVRPNLTLHHMLQVLQRSGELDRDIISSIKRVLNVCNEAIHGIRVKKRDAAEVLDLGLIVLNYLYDYYFQEIVEPLRKTKIAEDELRKYQEQKYRVTTVVPLVEKPYMNERILNQAQLDQFLEGYEEYGEFLVNIEEVKEDG